MNYRELSTDTWQNLDKGGDLLRGYKSRFIGKNDTSSTLHIFKDDSDHFHFVIEAPRIRPDDVKDPQVNGLQIQLAKYRLENGNINQYIDLKCTVSVYLEEFTEIVREITELILEESAHPLEAVNRIVDNWISFWSNLRKPILSEEKQIGLICELLTLDKIAHFDSKKALSAWTGPLGDKHDFNCLDWNIEVKGTKQSERTHEINGIDQLKPSDKKQLALISLRLINSENDNSFNLTTLVKSISKNHFDSSSLFTKFKELLASAGYNPVHEKEYVNHNYELLEAVFYEVTKEFPKLTSDMLSIAPDNRVSSIRYTINLEGLRGIPFHEVNWGNYFY
ncbi:MAG: PD-(D/E)XK motif protein [Saprospiraceae bacterium]|nr:PD-(D/E)XK motif protein [Saprospiraceae bacterium]